MTWSSWFTLIVAALLFIGLAFEFAADALLVGAVVVLAVAGIISPQEAFAGFANEGMLTVAALFVVAAAMRETGALDTIGGVLLGKANNERSVLGRMSLLVTTISAFMNNTPVVAMLLPVLTGWCRKHRVSPSRILIPLSYMTILGGTCTLIGTSTNLVVNGLLVNASKTNAALHPMSLFEMSYVGIPSAIAGCLYLLTVGRRLLPERKDLIDQLGESFREYIVDMKIQPGCRLIGQRVEEAGLRHLPGLFLIEIVRGEQVIAPVAPDQALEEGDTLAFTGAVNTIIDLERIPGLAPIADEGYEARAHERRGRMLSEAVISNTSPLAGKSIRDADFRAVYNAAVVAVHRGGERLRGRVGDIVLRNGDTLLLQTGPHFARAHRNNPDFFLVSGVEDSQPVRHERSMLSLILLGALVLLLVTEKMSTVMTAFIIAGLMVVTRCISVSGARQSIDWQTLITIAASFGVGKALENSGFVSVVADLIVAHAGSAGPYVVMLTVYGVTLVATELISNNAAAVLMFPFAVAMAGGMGVDPRPFVMAVTFAASSGFAIPLGYQTHLMVYGPGGYRFMDFVRVGLPMDILLMAVNTTLIPLAWPFHP
ncbi:MAG: SLC13 family permease [Candidatus Hydrogenedentes bacterium]|nr:SLC13 family permease [Candidatus Hydrogenedentota bacterium]